MPSDIQTKDIGVIRDGKKVCRGPLHPEGKWVPTDRYYVFKSGRDKGRLFPRCIPCSLKTARPNLEVVGMIDTTTEVLNIFRELQNRVGRKEACRRMGQSNNYLRLLLETKQYSRVHLKTVIKAKKALDEARANNEVRHKKSILHGSYLRGRDEREPTRTRDFYNGNNDLDNDQRRERAKRQAKGKDA